MADDIDKIKLAVMNKIGKEVLTKAIRLAPMYTGNIRNPANNGYRIEGDKIIVFFTDENAMANEYGTQPGILNPQESKELKKWAKYRGMEGAYKNIKKKIEKEGIQVGTVNNPMKTPNNTYRPFLRPAVYQTLSSSNINRIVKEAMRGE